MALSSSHLSHKLGYRSSFPESPYVHVCYLGNVLVLSAINPGLLLIKLQKNAPDYVKVGS